MAAGEDVLRVCYEQVGEDELQQARHDGLLVHGLLLWLDEVQQLVGQAHDR